MNLISGSRSILFTFLVLLLGYQTKADNDTFPTDFDGANVNIGERLFLETRFSEYFFAHSGGDVNATVPGDPTVATLKTTSKPVLGPFAGQAMNCRQCHLVDEKGYGDFGDHTLGNRTYADFTRRSPVPPRDDGLTQTTRNSMPLVDALLPRNVPLFLHHDGQFASAHDLIIGTLTGRTYGWKPDEYATAVHHIANVIRDDDGVGYLALMARDSRFAIELPGETAYANVFSGFNSYQGNFLFDPRTLTSDLISPQFWLDMRPGAATDEQILDTVATLIEKYLRNLALSQATNGVDFVGNGTPIFNGSPFDVFLIKNNLPQLPDTNETSAEYAQRLLKLVSQLPHPQYVIDPADGEFTTHKQTFRFGPRELQGLEIFLRNKDSESNKPNSNVGNCATCHSLPAFTDFVFHNTGVAQEEYDAIHGSGSFKKLEVPDFATRQANYDAYLPPTPQHPFATGIFETPPVKTQLGATDLGLWNVYANPDFPAPQAGIEQILPRLLRLPTPQIANARVSGDQTGGTDTRSFTILGTNGAPGGTYYVMASTDPLLPMTNWVIIATNTFDQQGHGSVSIPLSDMTQTFFRLSIQLPGPAEVLPQMLARFKTPTVRDLGHSNPYLHTGRMNSFEAVARFYQTFSKKARQGAVRNGDPELSNIVLNDSAIVPLAAFLRSLNEDYTD
ncbi:MAG TPA: hypothetical protein VH597_01300 [Verrucomicrobiae bacterium]|jgi:hypothetical protein|nr:hypothetical protein [Verrucomicrobiae bacterium]